MFRTSLDRADCLQEPLPRVGIPTPEPVTASRRSRHCHLLAVKAVLEPEDGGWEED